MKTNDFGTIFHTCQEIQCLPYVGTLVPFYSFLIKLSFLSFFLDNCFGKLFLSFCFVIVKLNIFENFVSNFQRILLDALASLDLLIAD